MSCEKRAPSRWWYGVAGLVFAAGWVGFAVFLFLMLGGISQGLTQLILPGSHQLSLDRTGQYTVYYEYQSVVGNRVFSTPEALPGIECRLTDSGGNPVALSPSGTSISFSSGGRSGFSVLEFDIAEPGRYVFSGDYPAGTSGPDVVFSIGQGLGTRILVTVLGALGIVFGCIIAAAAIALITFLKRRAARRATV